MMYRTSGTASLWPYEHRTAQQLVYSGFCLMWRPCRKVSKRPHSLGQGRVTRTYTSDVRTRHLVRTRALYTSWSSHASLCIGPTFCENAVLSPSLPYYIFHFKQFFSCFSSCFCLWEHVCLLMLSVSLNCEPKQQVWAGCLLGRDWNSNYRHVLTKGVCACLPLVTNLPRPWELCVLRRK